MTTEAELAHCTGDPGCPVRFRYGAPRPCVDHAGEDCRLTARVAGYGVVMQAQPGERDGQEPGTNDSA